MTNRILLSLLALMLPAFVFAGSSNSLMDVRFDGRMLLVANTDSGTVSLVDLSTRQLVAEMPVGEKPESVTWIGNGPLAAVTVYWTDEVVFLDTEQRKVVERIKVSNEPYGIVASREGRRLWLTHDYWGTVSEIDVPTRKVVREIPVARFIRGIALSPDETRLYITGYYNADLYVLDIASGKLIDHVPGHEQYNLARQVVAHPHRPKVYIPHIRTRTHIADSAGSIFPELSIVHLDRPKDAKRRTRIAMDTFNNLAVPTNPWECAISPDGKTFYLIYAGTDDMNLCNVLDDDYQEIERRGNTALIPVGTHPRAIRTSPDGKEVYIYNTMDFEVGIYDAQTMRPVTRIKVTQPPKSPEWVRGKILFNTAKPPLTSRRWIACASCHPDGHHDGRTWQNPEGLRRTPQLFGLAHTHPLHWSADRDEVQDFEYTIRGRLMLGRGLISGPVKPKLGFEPVELEEKLSGRSKDLDALAVYTNSFSFRLSPHILAPGKLTPAAERGKVLFFSKETGCANCHSGPYYTDSSLQRPFRVHDVGTGQDDPTEKMGPKYDTPTLLGIYRNATFLHHGKAKTLHEVLTAYNRGDKHGKTSHLSKQELDDLVAFLLSLPYDYPPEETPNTIPYRFVPRNNKSP
ncbi:MAG: c-type cytochrome [Gemmatales bacterium]|nr:c-type cytochrome [Gemmatales bacterium]MCS7160908.1 c-type cytochrome [Gemmatales bacterium]MDW8176110.1 c-type cytochrome [Gemmatales bacterium]MDW8222319.1 c-type cytochrome [Gemmatales bacterium]